MLTPARLKHYENSYYQYFDTFSFIQDQEVYTHTHMYVCITENMNFYSSGFKSILNIV